LLPGGAPGLKGKSRHQFRWVTLRREEDWREIRFRRKGSWLEQTFFHKHGKSKKGSLIDVGRRQGERRGGLSYSPRGKRKRKEKKEGEGKKNTFRRKSFHPSFRQESGVRYQERRARQHEQGGVGGSDLSLTGEGEERVTI